ncbi:MAG TPA: inositol monophosphatase family protein [Gemmatimonadaceae bacterium]|nr:inositol monophosphatase family protein [Gemmatimonadaceae bacterium]
MSAPNAVQWSQPEREGLLGVALTAAMGAAALIRGRSDEASTLNWREKSPADFVSDVDTAAEETIRAVIARECPTALVIAEEGSPDAVLGETIAFIVDPLDGTTNFLHGYPEYAVSIAAVEHGATVAGVVLNAATGERFTARAGAGAWRNGARIHVSAITTPGRALVGTGFPFKHLEQLDLYQRQFAAVMRSTSGIRRAGAASLDLADVACGRFDAFWELSLMPWDFAAGMLLVREAGGVVTDLSAGAPAFAPSGLVAGNPAMHRWLLEALAGAA